MLVLLPPSQGKATPDRGRRAGLSTLVYPRLRPARERLLDAVDPALRAAPALPAADLYTGVLFAALGLRDLEDRWGDVLIASALWGVVRPGDRIPAYRLDMAAKPAGVGGLAAFWREPLRAALPDRGLILDLRSGGYAAAWQPRRATRLQVRGFTEVGARRTVITHMVKRVRGDVARLVLQAPAAPRTPEDVAAIAEAGGLRVELTDASLDVVERG